MPIPLGIFAVAGAGAAASGAYEQIASVVGNDTSTTITLSSIPQTYKHLQIRFTGRVNNNTSGHQMYVRANGDTNSNYSSHGLGATSSINGFSSQSNVMVTGRELIPGTQETAGFVGHGVIDILDYKETSKFKTIRMLAGRTSTIATTVSVSLLSTGNWRSTSAITSLEFTMSGPGNWTGLTRFTIYGIKG